MRLASNFFIQPHDYSGPEEASRLDTAEISRPKPGEVSIGSSEKADAFHTLGLS